MELYRVSALSRFEQTPDVISTILLERAFGLAIIGAFAAVGLPLSLRYLQTSPGLLVWVIVLIAAVMVFGVWLSLSPSVVKNIARQNPTVSNLRRKLPRQ